MNERLKKLRKILDLTQQNFANRLGIKRNTVATYEAGKSNPSDSAVLLICREFNVNEKWLRTGEGEIFNPTPNSELKALKKKYNLSDEAYMLIEIFMNLKERQQDALIDFIKEAAAALNEINLQKKADSDTSPFDIDIDAEVESYRRALELQKKVETESSALNGYGVNAENKKKA